MCSKTNEMITGKYEHYGESNVYSDTDSVDGKTVINTSLGNISIEDLFEHCAEKWNVDDKEYSYDPDLMVMSYHNEICEPYMGHIEYIYRHKTNKELYEIEDELGNIVVVTEDHSVMIERNGVLTSVKPADILDTDILISIKEK